MGVFSFGNDYYTRYTLSRWVLGCIDTNGSVLVDLYHRGLIWSRQAIIGLMSWSLYSPTLLFCSLI